MKKLLILTAIILSSGIVQAMRPQLPRIEVEEEPKPEMKLSDWRPRVYLPEGYHALRNTVIAETNVSNFDSWLDQIKRSFERGTLTKAVITDFINIVEVKKNELNNLLNKVDQSIGVETESEQLRTEELQEELIQRIKKAIQSLEFKQKAARVLLRDLK